VITSVLAARLVVTTVVEPVEVETVVGHGEVVVAVVVVTVVAVVVAGVVVLLVVGGAVDVVAAAVDVATDPTGVTVVVPDAPTVVTAVPVPGRASVVIATEQGGPAERPPEGALTSRAADAAPAVASTTRATAASARRTIEPP
jgi:hypothetical protein